MKLRNRLRFAGSALKMAATGTDPVVREAEDLRALQTEMNGFTQLGGSIRDLPAYDQTKMQNVAIRLYRNDHMAKRMLDIIVDFVLGDGLNITAIHDDEATRDALQEIFDEFWGDPINDMKRYNPQRLNEMNIWGEMIMPVRVFEETGLTRLGWIDVSMVEGIIPDPVTQRPGWVVVTDDAVKWTGKKKLEVVRYSQDAGEMVGEVVYNAINTTAAGRRGISEFYPAADWFDVLDETMKAAADKAKLMNYTMWDVTMVGATQAEIDAYIKTLAAPRPNTIRVHNDGVIWKELAPSIGAYEASRHLKDLRSFITGGYGYPLHWFGDGGDANLATASAMAEPTRKALRRKTKEFTYALNDLIRFVLTQKSKVGLLPVGVDPLDDVFRIDVPDIGGADVAKVGSAMQAITASVTMALDNDLIAIDTARSLFSAVATLTGVDIDPDAEKTKIEAEDVRRDKGDEDERAAAADRIRVQLTGPNAVSPTGEDDA